MANHARSSGNPDAGDCEIEQSLRAARVSADRTSRSGSNAFSGYPECKLTTSFIGILSVGDKDGIGLSKAPKAAVCQLKSLGVTVLIALVKVPTPGLDSMRPSVAKALRAC